MRLRFGLSKASANTILANCPTAILCVSRTHRVIFSNEAANRLLGLGDSLVSLSIELILPEWAAILSDPRHSTEIETILRHGPDGERSPIDVRITDVAEEGFYIVSASLRQISIQKANADSLEESREEVARALEEAKTAERRMRAIIEMMPQAVCVFDAEDRYVLWNEKYAETYPELAPLLKPQAPFADVLRASVAGPSSNQYVADLETYLGQRLARHALPFSQEEQELRDGRWLRHDDRRLADGGTLGMRIDITDLKHREASFRLLFQDNPVPMFISDPETLRIIDANEAATKLYGFDREILLSKSAPELHPEDQAKEVRQILSSIVDAYDDRTIWRQRTAAGSEIHVLIFVRALLHERRRGLLTAVTDVSDRVRAEASITYMAHHDPLTGLANRLHFHTALEQALTETERGICGLAILYVDLDGFKPVNDTMGHRTGDNLLRAVASRLTSVVRSKELIARLGGDEFAILLYQSNDLSEVVATRVIATLGQPFEIDGHIVTISASIGVAVLPAGAAVTGPDPLIAAADTALYEAKRAGKNTWRKNENVGSAKGQDGVASTMRARA